MKNLRVIAASFMVCLMLPLIMEAQSADTSVIIPAVRLDGPRVGVTYVANNDFSKDMKDKLGITVEPFLTQFGWQFETRFFKLPSGTSGLVEGVLLVAGLEQGVFLPSGSLLIGLRNSKGVEFGFGPNVSLSGAAFVFAVGVTLRSHDVNFPINFAVVPSSDGARFSLLFGFNARHR